MSRQSSSRLTSYHDRCAHVQSIQYNHQISRKEKLRTSKKRLREMGRQQQNLSHRKQRNCPRNRKNHLFIQGSLDATGSWRYTPNNFAISPATDNTHPTGALWSAMTLLPMLLLNFSFLASNLSCSLRCLIRLSHSCISRSERKVTCRPRPGRA